MISYTFHFLSLFPVPSYTYFHQPENPRILQQFILQDNSDFAQGSSTVYNRKDLKQDILDYDLLYIPQIVNQATMLVQSTLQCICHCCPFVKNGRAESFIVCNRTVQTLQCKTSPHTNQNATLMFLFHILYLVDQKLKQFQQSNQTCLCYLFSKNFFLHQSNSY